MEKLIKIIEHRIVSDNLLLKYRLSYRFPGRPEPATIIQPGLNQDCENVKPPSSPERPQGLAFHPAGRLYTHFNLGTEVRSVLNMTPRSLRQSFSSIGPPSGPSIGCLVLLLCWFKISSLHSQFLSESGCHVRMKKQLYPVRGWKIYQSGPQRYQGLRWTAYHPLLLPASWLMSKGRLLTSSPSCPSLHTLSLWSKTPVSMLSTQTENRAITIAC